MGGALVDQSPPHTTYTEQFYEVFPYYLSIGMTYDQFWNDDCYLAKYYREAQKLREKRANVQAWLQGAYIYIALDRLKPIFGLRGGRVEPYLEEPLPLTSQEAEERQRAKEEQNLKKAVAMFSAWAAKLNLPEGGE